MMENTLVNASSSSIVLREAKNRIINRKIKKGFKRPSYRGKHIAYVYRNISYMVFKKWNRLV